MIPSGRVHADRLDQRVNKGLRRREKTAWNKAEQNIQPGLQTQYGEAKNYRKTNHKLAKSTVTALKFTLFKNEHIFAIIYQIKYNCLKFEQNQRKINQIGHKAALKIRISCPVSAVYTIGCIKNRTLIA